MDKKYSKKQILEAINYWQSVLKMIDESKSPLLDSFAKKFGEDIVFGDSKNKNILPSLEMIEDIFDIANDIIFNSKLMHRDFKVVGIVEKLKFASYVFAKAKKQGKPIFVDKIFHASNGKVFYPPYFEISSLMLQFKMPFNYLASIVVHEMIHQYTIEIGNELQQQEDDILNNKVHDPHKGDFEKMMNSINDKYGLSIEVSCDINNIKAEFEKAIQRAKNMLESENRNIVYDSDNMTIEKPSTEDIYLVHMY